MATLRVRFASRNRWTRSFSNSNWHRSPTCQLRHSPHGIRHTTIGHTAAHRNQITAALILARANFVPTWFRRHRFTTYQDNSDAEIMENVSKLKAGSHVYTGGDDGRYGGSRGTAERRLPGRLGRRHRHLNPLKHSHRVIVFPRSSAGRLHASISFSPSGSGRVGPESAPNSCRKEHTVFFEGTRLANLKTARTPDQRDECFKRRSIHSFFAEQDICGIIPSNLRWSQRTVAWRDEKVNSPPFEIALMLVLSITLPASS
jgi:hypothetical protein